MCGKQKISFIYLQHFNDLFIITKSFQVTDGRIFGGDSAWQPLASFDQNNSWQRLNTLQPVTVCDIYITCDTSCKRAFKTSSTADYYWCGCPAVQNLCTVRWLNVDPGAGTLPSLFYITDIGGGGTSDPLSWWVNPCPNGGGGSVSKMSVTEECSASGWTPMPTTGGILYPQLGFHHLETWDVSAEDYGKIEYWRQNNIDTSLLDSCIKKIIEKLMSNLNGNFLGKILSKMDRSIFEPTNIEKFKIKFLWDNTLDSFDIGRFTADTFVQSTGVFVGRIRLNPRFKEISTELAWAHTILHEMIHGYMASIHYRYFYNLNASQIKNMKYDSLFTNYVDTLLARTTRKGLNTFYTINQGYQHNYMADKLLNKFAEGLELFDESRITNRRYYWLYSWDGLWESRTIRSHWPNRKDSIPANRWPPLNPAPSDDSTRGLLYALTISRIDSMYKAAQAESYGTSSALGRRKISGGCY